MRERFCEVCKADLDFSLHAECTFGRTVHTILCQSCRTTVDRRIMALPQWRRHHQLQQTFEVLLALANSGKDTSAELHTATEEWLSLQIELHDTIIAILGRPATT